MTFNTYEELLAVVKERKKDTLSLEIDLGGEFSPAHEEAKRELQQAKALKAVTGGTFLSDNMKELENAVEATRPPGKPVWLRFSRLSSGDWTALTKNAKATPLEQFEVAGPKTFLGVFSSVDAKEPLSTDPAIISVNGTNSILFGGMLYGVVEKYMEWQNSGGNVNIHPTKSGQN